MLLSMARGMWRYRWPALLAAWATCAVGWIYIYAMPDVYQASTRLYIDAESMVKRVVGDLTVSGDSMSEISILTRALLSQPNLEKTARLANLDLEANTAAEREQLLASLGQRIRLTPEGGENVFRISFQDSNRQVAETVVQTVYDNFVEGAHEERRTDSGAASDFVEQQIKEYEGRLNAAEKRLADFKRENIGLMPGETGDYYTRLQRAMAAVEKTRGELQLANERRAEYQNQLVGEEPVFGILSPSLSGGAVGSTDAQIARFESDLSDLLLRYTDNHPDVVALRETIARLKSERGELSPDSLPTSVRAGGSGELETNPVYQSMRLGLSETEIEITTLRSKLASEQASVTELQRLVDTIPEIERQLTALNRDYAVTRDQFEQLLKRRESLHMTGEVESTGDQLAFRVIDPPRAGILPVGPDRPLLLVGTTVAALGLGLAVALLLQQLNPVFGSRRELRDWTGLPVLGTVSLAESRAVRSLAFRRSMVFVGAVAALPVALGVAVLLQGPAHRLVAGFLGGSL